MFNHYDSYPGGSGVYILEFIKKVNIGCGWDKIKESVSSMSTIEDDYGNFEIGIEDFLSRLYNGKIKNTNTDSEFIKDSLFCEYAYIINLDSMKLEFYNGFQKKPQIGNRFGVELKKGYYPCRLVYVFDLYADIYGVDQKMIKISENDVDDPSVSKYFRKKKLEKIYN